MALMLGSSKDIPKVTIKEAKKEEKPSESKDEKKSKDAKSEDKKKDEKKSDTSSDSGGPEKHLLIIGGVLLVAARILGLVTTWHAILLFLGLLLIAAIISVVRDPEKLRDTVVSIFCVLALLSVIVTAWRIVGFSDDLFMTYIRSITN